MKRERKIICAYKEKNNCKLIDDKFSSNCIIRVWNTEKKVVESFAENKKSVCKYCQRKQFENELNLCEF